MQAIWTIAGIFIIEVMIISMIAYGQPAKKKEEKKKERFRINIEEN